MDRNSDNNIDICINRDIHTTSGMDIRMNRNMDRHRQKQKHKYKQGQTQKQY